MKTLQDRMNDMKPYFRGIEMYNEALMVKVVMPANWKCYPSADGRIKVTPSDSDNSLVYYYADANNCTYEEIFDLIEETIKENQNIILKLKLLKEKVEELKELFSNNSYEELLKLSFEFKKSTKKTKVKKKEEIKETEENKDEQKENN